MGTDRTGVLLLNLGTPDSPSAEDVRRYLGEFLMDPFVVDIPWIARFLLVNGIILRTRPRRSAEAYRKVWTDRGSPLLFHTVDLAAKVQARLGDGYRVLPVMRYGKPGVAAALAEFSAAGIGEARVLPLYPQYSLAASRSSVEWVRSEAERTGYRGELRFGEAFYDDAAFLDAFAERVRGATSAFRPDRLLFSFHGLPERHLRKTERAPGHCLARPGCCDRITEANRDCYRAQCYRTARGIAERAGVPPGGYDVAFQSRLGRTPWIQPFTDVLLRGLAAKGSARRLLVASPSFVADCLETLEEIEIRSRADFIAAGGEDLALVPSLNSEDRWAECVRGLVLRLAEPRSGLVGSEPRA